MANFTSLTIFTPAEIRLTLKPNTMKKNPTPPQPAITTGFDGLSGPAFASLSGGILGAMTGNPYFPDPDPPMPVIAELLGNYIESANVAQNRDRDAVETKSVNRNLLTASLKTLGKYVTLTANGDRQKLVSSGYPMNRRGEPVPPLGKPENIQATDGINPGSVYISVNAVKRAKSYLYQYTLDPVTETSVWETASGTARSFTFTNLKRNTRFAFRIAAVGSRNQTVYSDIITRVVQ